MIDQEIETLLCAIDLAIQLGCATPTPISKPKLPLPSALAVSVLHARLALFFPAKISGFPPISQLFMLMFTEMNGDQRLEHIKRFVNGVSAILGNSSTCFGSTPWLFQWAENEANTSHDN